MAESTTHAAGAGTVTFIPAPSLDAVRAGDAVLEKGQRGDAVGHVQRLLHLDDDNKFGNDTRGAVAAFQQGKGMAIDPGFLGKVGRFTLAALEQQGISVPAVSTVPATAGNFDPEHHLDRVHPELRKRLLAVVAALAAKSMALRITDGVRTFAEQDKLFQKGRVLVNGKWQCKFVKCRDTVTNAPGGFSNHNYGLAVDCYPVLDGKIFFDTPKNAALATRFSAVQKAIGVEGERVGLTWGGRWDSPFDPPHLQLLGQKAFPPRECLDVFRAHGNSMQAVWDEATRRLNHGTL